MRSPEEIQTRIAEIGEETAELYFKDPADRLLDKLHQCKEGVTLEPETHTYRTPDGARWPGVTQILGAAGFDDWMKFVDPSELEYAARRGTAVHLACQLEFEGDLDWDSLDPIVRPYVDAFARWRSQTAFVPVFAEEPLLSLRGFAGKPDLVGLFGSIPAVIDIKTPAQVPESTPLQTAGYCDLLRLVKPIRMALRLGADGNFKVTEFRDRHHDRDLITWRAALQIWKWRN